MNKGELKAILEEKNVPKISYSLDGLKQGECLCIINENGKWKVVYNSRGVISYSEDCDGEESACDKFFEIMKNDYGW
jgi:hypothetical protein